MPHPDPIQRLREALVAICNENATLRTLTGRTSRILVRWSGLQTAALPVVAYQIIGFQQVGEDRDARDGTVQFTAVAAGPQADRVVEELLAAVEQAVTATALDAQGVDGAPLLWTRRGGEDDPPGDAADSPTLGPRGLMQAHLDGTFTITQ